MNWQLRRELLTNVAAVMGGGLQAALNLDFTTLTPATMATAGVTFSRASLATQYDSTGKLTWAPNNALVRSQEINDAAWTLGGLNIVANATTAPDGTSTAEQIYSTGSTSLNSDYVQQQVTLPIGNVMASVYVKANGFRWMTLSIFDGGHKRSWFDLQNGVVGTQGGGTTNAISSVGSGWYLISVKYNSSTANPYINFGCVDADNSLAITGSGTNGVYVWGAQIEAVTYETAARTYNATVGSAYYGPRFDYNPSTLAAKGLLIEEARTNYFLQSNFASGWTGNNGGTLTGASGTSPDGTNNASKITSTGGSGAYRGVFQTPLISGAATISVYAKANGVQWILLDIFDNSNNYDAWFDLTNGVVGSKSAGSTSTIQDVGNGWYRLTHSRTLAAGGPSPGIFPCDGDGNTTFTSTGSNGPLVYGAQAEQGAFSTSYIPTTSASATRAADQAAMTGSNFSSWYNQNPGTLIVGMSLPVVSGTAYAANLADPGTNNDMLFGNIGGNWFVNINGEADIQLDPIVANTNSKIGMAFATNDVAGSSNGSSVVTDASANMITTISGLYIGKKYNDTTYWNGHIRSIKFYNTRVSNAQLQSLTT